MRQKLIILISFLLHLVGNAQITITEQQVIDSILKNHPSIQISDLKVMQGQARIKSSINLPNPEIIAESPTGEFYTIGVLQQIEFPTVYSRQHQFAKQQTLLMEKEKSITVLDVKYLARSLYLNFQYSSSLVHLLRLQDSIYAELSEIADRKYEAGEIDLISKTYSSSQYGEVHAKYLNGLANYQGYSNQLKIYISTKDSLFPSSIGKSTLSMPEIYSDSTQIKSNPVIQYYDQRVKVDELAWKVEKNKALPGIVFGYLNQGPDYTPSNLRFRAGITIPLWFWQYSGNIKAAKYSYEIAQEETELQKQILTKNLEFIKQQIYALGNNLNYYETTGLKQANDLLDASSRFFQSSEWDQISFLRIANDVFEIKMNYYSVLSEYNELLLQYHYLKGTL